MSGPVIEVTESAEVVEPPRWTRMRRVFPEVGVMDAVVQEALALQGLALLLVSRVWLTSPAAVTSNELLVAGVPGAAPGPVVSVALSV